MRCNVYFESSENGETELIAEGAEVDRGGVEECLRLEVLPGLHVGLLSAGVGTESGYGLGVDVAEVGDVVFVRKGGEFEFPQVDCLPGRLPDLYFARFCSEAGRSYLGAFIVVEA